jgi:hypothetical protein
MARIIFSSLVTSINGSAGGTTFQRNLYGNTLKNKPHMATPRSQYQNESKRIVSAVTQFWRTMSSVQRQTWIDYANAFPEATRLNPDSYLNGYNLFVKFNCIRYLANGSILQNVSLTQYNNAITGVELTEDAGDLFFAFSFSAYSYNHTALIFLSPKIQGFTSPRTNKTRFIKSYIPSAMTPGTELSTEYNARLGTSLVVGDSVYADITFINNDSGQILEIPTQVIEVIAP